MEIDGDKVIIEITGDEASFSSRKSVMNIGFGGQNVHKTTNISNFKIST